MGERILMLDEKSGKWVTVEGDDEKASIVFEVDLHHGDKSTDQVYRKTANIDVFKLTDIPKTMRKKGWEMGAKLQERWFSNRAYEMSENEKKIKKGVNLLIIQKI
jgi:hypothetical protein